MASTRCSQFDRAEPSKQRTEDWPNQQSSCQNLRFMTSFLKIQVAHAWVAVEFALLHSDDPLEAKMSP